MRGLEKFLLGIFLPIGVLLLFTAISGLINVPRVFPTIATVSAQSCSPVASCTAIGCGNSDSCGNYCGDCAATPPSGTTKTPQAKNDSSIPVLSGIGEVKDQLGRINLNFVGDGLKKLVGGIIENIIRSLAGILVGNPNAIPASAPIIGGSSPSDNLSYIYERYGALGALGLGMQEMYDNPPVTTVDYLATIKPIAPAFAQEGGKEGREVLKPLSGYWAVSRNLAYIFFVLILVSIGLMIMFRSKIDPRTTVTVSAALPNLIVSLVLITFSLALAGLIIDIGRIFMELFKGILGGALSGNQPLPGIDANNGVGLSPYSIWQSFIVNWNNGVSFGGTGGAIIGGFVYFIIGVFAFVVGIQVFIMLLMRYINLILKPIFAPFVFLFGALPGKGGNAGNWFKGYLVDALTFPLVFMILNIALSIKNNTGSVVKNDPFGVFLPDSNLNSLIAIGIVFLATKVPALLEDAMDLKPSSHVEKSGAQPGQMLKQVPIVKNLL